MNRSTVTIDSVGNRVTSLHEAAGNVTGSLHARGDLTKYLFDALNPLSVTAQNRATVTVDAHRCFMLSRIRGTPWI